MILDRVVERSTVGFGLSMVPSHKSYPNCPWWRDERDNIFLMLNRHGEGATSCEFPFDAIIAFCRWSRYRLPIEWRLSRARRLCGRDGHLLREKSWGNGYVERECVRCEAEMGYFRPDGKPVLDWCAEGHVLNTSWERRGDGAYCRKCGELLALLPSECGALGIGNNRCTCPKGHSGPHGYWLGGGAVLAPWD